MAKAAKTPVEPENSPAPLAVEEINHLIETARAETYQASETAPKKEPGVFKPKSLMELAREARLKEPPPETVPEVVPVTPDSAMDEPLEVQFEPAAPMAEPAPLEDLPKAAAPAPYLVPEPEPIAAAPSFDPDHLERVRAEAFAAGQAEARRTDGEALQQALAALEAATQALTAPPESALADMRATMESSVRQLASARAGMAIDDLPEPFMRRIEELADRVHACASAPVLRLHPDDLEAIIDHVSQSEILSTMRMVAKEDLSRGDVELCLGGLTMADCLEPPERRRRAVFRHRGAATEASE